MFKLYFKVATTLLITTFFNLSEAETLIDFARDIKPILSDKCYACHGPDATTEKVAEKTDFD